MISQIEWKKKFIILYMYELLLDKIIFVRLQAIISRGLREREIKGIMCLTTCHMLPWRIFIHFYIGFTCSWQVSATRQELNPFMAYMWKLRKKSISERTQCITLTAHMGNDLINPMYWV